MGFEVATEQFSGPLQLLLDIIEREELPITDVSLAKITEDYVNYLQIQKVPPEDLADFLVVASSLLLIKSRALLPQLQIDEEEGPDLASQLALYKEFVEMAKEIEKKYG